MSKDNKEVKNEESKYKEQATKLVESIFGTPKKEIVSDKK